MGRAFGGASQTRRLTTRSRPERSDAVTGLITEPLRLHRVTAARGWFALHGPPGRGRAPRVRRRGSNARRASSGGDSSTPTRACRPRRRARYDGDRDPRSSGHRRLSVVDCLSCGGALKPTSCYSAGSGGRRSCRGLTDARWLPGEMIDGARRSRSSRAFARAARRTAGHGGSGRKTRPDQCRSIALMRGRGRRRFHDSMPRCAVQGTLMVESFETGGAINLFRRLPAR